MDDLAGLSWSSSASQSQSKQQTQAASNSNYFPTLRPTPPVSGRSTPANAPSHGTVTRAAGGVASKSSTPANDSFANLLPFGSSAQTTKTLSLQEQQRALEAQKAQRLGFGGALPSRGLSASPQPNSTASSGRSTPIHTLPSSLQVLGYQRSGSSQSTGFQSIGQDFSGNGQNAPRLQRAESEKEEDILAAFNADAPVDASSHFPAPADGGRASTKPAPMAAATPSQSNGTENYAALDDDDPFGLGTSAPLTSKNLSAMPNTGLGNAGDEDDVLGLLGKPVSELPPKKEEKSMPEEAANSAEDKALAELIDMGFPTEKAQEALSNTDSGVDVQAAVGWLLNQAHANSRSKAETVNADRERDGRASASRREASRSPMPAEDKDPSKLASELGSNFFKTANSLWKTSQKKFNKAVAEFNTDTDSPQPKWMRETQPSPSEERTRPDTDPRPTPPRRPRQQPAGSSGQAGLIDMTDEAKMLESGGGRPQPKQRPQNQRAEQTSQSPPPAKMQPAAAMQNRFPQQPQRPSRRFVEEEATQAYISPARRKKAPAPAATISEPDLLFGESQASAPVSKNRSGPPSVTQPRPQPKIKSTPLVTRPKAPPRNVPSISSIALRSSTAHRQKGNAAFKLGNYGEATEAYSASLRDIPSKHPLALLLLTNRALTHLKTGDPKAAIADAETAIEILGPARGVDEEIDVDGDEGKKPMAPFWGKAMMRRAEAMEQLERWADAGKVWAECVQAGVGGAQSIQGRSRCEKAVAPKPSAPPRRPTPATRPTPKPAPRASALYDLGGRPSSAPIASGAAVNRLRAANAAADKADDERFALADSVDAKLLAWRKGKETNLRALLGSLDTVLWEGSGWKKVGMSELLQPNKVKIAYMKGIAKVHPDKLPTSATTEQVMISGAVFATLNEAWDKFKAENGL